MNNNLTIVIPTYKYSKYLDIAIASCLKLKYVDASIFVNINSKDQSFKNSTYWNNINVNWRYIDSPTIYMHESFNDAIRHSKGDWIFILSDDDIIEEDILKGYDLSTKSSYDLYAIHLRIIDIHGEEIKKIKLSKKVEYSSEEAINLFFNKEIQHHLSLFIFNRVLFEEVGGFKFGGYPNGYYVDSIVFGKFLANCNSVYFSQQVDFSRRESQFQGSSKIYYDTSVNSYFDIIIDELFNDENYSSKALAKFGTKKGNYRFEIQHRFDIDFYKFFYPIYNAGIKDKIKFIYSFLFFWDTGIVFKIRCLTYRIVIMYLRIKINKLIKWSN